MMGVGKSTLGKMVSKRLNLKFVDVDAGIEKKLSMTISDIFYKKGEKFFRKQEEEEVLESLKKDDHVIALGGGAFINKVVREAVLKNSISVWLDVSLNKLYNRIKWNKKRPLLKVKDAKDTIKKLYSERKKIYKLANYKINCNYLNKEDIVKKILNIYEKE